MRNMKKNLKIYEVSLQNRMILSFKFMSMCTFPLNVSIEISYSENIFNIWVQFLFHNLASLWYSYSVGNTVYFLMTHEMFPLSLYPNPEHTNNFKDFLVLNQLSATSSKIFF